MTTSRVAKVAVVTCSVLLAGGYLYYANSNSLKTSSKRAHITAGEGGAPLETEVFTTPAGTPEKDPNPMPAVPRTLAFGSKSGEVSLSPTTQPRTIVQSGWKSAPVTVMPDPPDQRTIASSSKFARVTVPPSGEGRTMLSGSKSNEIHLMPTTQPRTMAPGSKSFQLIPPASDQRQLMLSSKGGVVVNPPGGPSDPTHVGGGLMTIDIIEANPATQPSTQPATQPATAPATRRVLFDGSKSAPVRIPQQQK